MLKNPEPRYGPDFLSTYGTDPAVAMMVATSTTFAVANQAVLIPVTPFRDITVAALNWVTVATSSGNYDIGIYDAAGTRLWSKGSTAWPVVSTVNADTVSPAVVLRQGITYWIALASDATTGTFRGTTAQGGQLQMLDGTNFARTVAAAFPLPASITLGSTAGTRLPIIVLREA